MTAHCKPLPRMQTTEELVLLVRVLPFDDAVKLLNEFARHHETAGRMDHAVNIFNRVSCGLEAKP